MATTTPPIPDRSDGEVIDETWFDLLKEVVENHEDRLLNYEAEARAHEFNFMGVVEFLVGIDDVSGIMVLEEDIDVLEVKAFVKKAGSSGNFVPKLQYKRGAGAWTDICSADPDVAFGDGDYAEALGTIDAGNDQLLEGDLIRTNLTSAQVGQKDGKLTFKYEPTVFT